MHKYDIKIAYLTRIKRSNKLKKRVKWMYVNIYAYIVYQSVFKIFLSCVDYQNCVNANGDVRSLRFVYIIKLMVEF